MSDEIYDNKQIIYRLNFSNGENYTIGSNIKKIKAVKVNGEMAYITWFDLYDDKNNLMIKINSKYVESIEYKTNK